MEFPLSEPFIEDFGGYPPARVWGPGQTQDHSKQAEPERAMSPPVDPVQLTHPSDFQAGGLAAPSQECCDPCKTSAPAGSPRPPGTAETSF